MTKKEKEDLKALAEAAKKLTESDKKYLIGIAEGISMANTNAEK